MDHYSTSSVSDMITDIGELIRKIDLEFLIVHILGSFKNKEHRITTELAQTHMHKSSTNNIPLIALEMGQNNPNTIFLFFYVTFHQAEAGELEPKYPPDFWVPSNTDNHLFLHHSLSGSTKRLPCTTY